jgi:hypothetical protein
MSLLPLLILALVISPCAAAAQDIGVQTAPGVQTGSTQVPGAQAIPAVPRSFHGLELGMGMDEAKKVLASDGLFHYRGDVDVSLLPRPNETLIEVAGLSYVKRAFFQFYEDKLFVMIFAMNEKEMDHYSVFTSLSAKYGKPNTLSPSESVWEDAATRLSVERPLAVKYIDLEIFNALKKAGAAQSSYEEILRSEFLNGF